jgi:hypothetical protein
MPLILDALPEARFYSKEGNIISLLKAGHPNAPALPVLDTEFWRLIATHPTTHGVVPQARSVYDSRASNIYSLLDSIPRDLAQDKLGWTTPHSLMRILIEEFRPSRELFSHALAAQHGHVDVARALLQAGACGGGSRCLWIQGAAHRGTRRARGRGASTGGARSRRGGS